MLYGNDTSKRFSYLVNRRFIIPAKSAMHSWPQTTSTGTSRHLTVESYMVVMLLTFILIIISIPSPPHSLIPGLNLSFSANPTHRSLPFLLHNLLHGCPRLFSDTSEHNCFLLFSFFCFPFLVLCAVQQIKLTHDSYRIKAQRLVGGPTANASNRKKTCTWVCWLLMYCQ